MNANDKREVMQLLTAEGLPAWAVTRLLSYGARLHTLAEAQCNGNWPADNGSGGTTCPKCESIWRVPMARISITQPDGGKLTELVCPDCKTEHQVRELVSQFKGFGVLTGGDPRGACLIVTCPSGKYNDWERRGIVCG